MGRRLGAGEVLLRGLPQENWARVNEGSLRSRKQRCPHKVGIKNLAERTGLEPATPGVTGRYSNQLNYRSNRALGARESGELYPTTGSVSSNPVVRIVDAHRRRERTQLP